MELEASQTRSSLRGVPAMWAETIVLGGVRMLTVWTPEWPPPLTMYWWGAEQGREWINFISIWTWKIIASSVEIQHWTAHIIRQVNCCVIYNPSSSVLDNPCIYIRRGKQTHFPLWRATSRITKLAKKKAYNHSKSFSICRNFGLKAITTVSIYTLSDLGVLSFKLLTVPFKPLHCRLQNDKLANCHVWNHSAKI